MPESEAGAGAAAEIAATTAHNAADAADDALEAARREPAPDLAALRAELAAAHEARLAASEAAASQRMSEINVELGSAIERLTACETKLAEATSEAAAMAARLEALATSLTPLPLVAAPSDAEVSEDVVDPLEVDLEPIQAREPPPPRPRKLRHLI
jgi:chromosome segregation ATPase